MALQFLWHDRIYLDVSINSKIFTFGAYLVQWSQDRLLAILAPSLQKFDTFQQCEFSPTSKSLTEIGKSPTSANAEILLADNAEPYIHEYFYWTKTSYAK